MLNLIKQLLVDVRNPKVKNLSFIFRCAGCGCDIVGSFFTIGGTGKYLIHINPCGNGCETGKIQSDYQLWQEAFSPDTPVETIDGDVIN